MTQMQFINYMTKIGQAINESLDDEQINIYFERLGRTQENVFRNAVNKVIDSHKFKSFPMIAEIKIAIEEVWNEINEATIKDLESIQQKEECQKCHNTGYEIYPVLHLGTEYSTAFYCSCEIGKRIKMSNEKRKKRYGDYDLSLHKVFE